MATKTSNYGMHLYDEADYFQVTGDADCLNHNFEIADSTLANKANGKGITFSVTSDGLLNVSTEE